MVIGATKESGNPVLLRQQIITSAVSEVVFDNVFDDSFNFYKIIINKLKPVTDGQHFYYNWRGSDNADVTGTYYYALIYAMTNAASGGFYTNASDTDKGRLSWTLGTGTQDAYYADMWCTPRSRLGGKYIRATYGHHRHDNYIAFHEQVAHLDDGEAMNGIKFFFGSGNIATAEIFIYGVE